MIRRIVGIGEPSAGDDAAGIRVVERLRELGVPRSTELHALRDPSELTLLLTRPGPLLIVDAALDPDREGSVHLLDAGRIELSARRPVSSHGLDLATAIEIARTLTGDASLPPLFLLAIAIREPRALGTTLSPKTAAAVEVAAIRALAWAREANHARNGTGETYSG